MPRISVLEQELDCCLRKYSCKRPARQMATHKASPHSWGPPLCRGTYCFHGVGSPSPHLHMFNSKCVWSSDSNATSSLKPPSSAPDGRGFIACVAEHYMWTFLYQGHSSVYPCCLQNLAIFRLISEFHSESYAGDGFLTASTYCQITVVGGRLLHATIQGSMILPRAEAWI